MCHAYKLSELVLRVSECVEAVSEWCRSVSIDTSVGRVDCVQCVSKCQLTLVSKCRAGAQLKARGLEGFKSPRPPITHAHDSKSKASELPRRAVLAILPRKDVPKHPLPGAEGKGGTEKGV